jgi:hypothetical protein
MWVLFGLGLAVAIRAHRVTPASWQVLGGDVAAGGAVAAGNHAFGGEVPAATAAGRRPLQECP